MYIGYPRRRSYAIKSIFSRLVSPLSSRGCHNDVASILVIKHVACPYCSSIYGVMVLASNVCGRIEKNMFFDDRSINYGFKETHLGNPIECVECSNKYIVFAAIERDRATRRIKDIHVKIVRYEEPYTELMRWPHMGLVSKNVIEYDPEEGAMIYDDLDHYASVNREDTTIVGTVKGYPSGEAQNAAGEEPGGKFKPPAKVKFG